MEICFQSPALLTSGVAVFFKISPSFCVVLRKEVVDLMSFSAAIRLARVFVSLNVFFVVFYGICALCTF